jgi:copper chaperone CopZ
MHCDGCVRRVKAVLGKIEGVSIESVIVGRAEVDDPSSDGLPIVEALKKAGFPSKETA